VGAYTVNIKENWCKGCKICVDFCPKDVLYMAENGKSAVGSIEACSGCKMCEYRCPDYAIKVGGREN